MALLWDKFPARIPIHWNIHGRIDGWASKPFGLLMLPVTNLFIYALLAFIQKIDPKLRNTSDDERTHALAVVRIIRTAAICFFAGIFCFQMAVALGFAVPMDCFAFNGCLLFLIVAGNYFANLRPNYLVGIRTPWTLENPGTWRATHRLGGRIMVFGSLGLIGVQFFIPRQTFVCLFVIFILGFAAWSYIYSWNHARAHVQVR